MKDVEKTCPISDGIQAKKDARLLLESILRDAPVPDLEQLSEEYKRHNPEVYNPDLDKIHVKGETRHSQHIGFR